MSKQRILSAAIGGFLLLNGPGLLTDTMISKENEQLEDSQKVPAQASSSSDLKASAPGERSDLSEYAVYQERMETIYSAVPLKFDKGVAWHFNKFLKDTYGTGKLITRANYYFPDFQDILLRQGVPTELANLALIESNLDPRAESPVGAGGFWQFMPNTGKRLGLKINDEIDQRRDPVASTLAAANYLKELNQRYDNWLFAIAAYNCGPGNVDKAIRRSGNSTEYEAIRLYLPKQTRAYVAKFMAATYLTTYYHLHDIQKRSDLKYPEHGYNFTAIESYDLNQIAEDQNVSLKDLRYLNPSLLALRVRNLEEPVVLRIPMGPLMTGATEEVILGRNN